MKFSVRIFMIHFMILFTYIVFVDFPTKRHVNKNRIIKMYSNKNEINVSIENKHTLKSLLYPTSSLFNASEIQGTKSKQQKIILQFNVPEYMKDLAQKDRLYTRCEYQNCVMSRNRSKLLSADAVIFYIGIRNERMGEHPPIPYLIRNPNQVWIFMSVEPPEHYYNTDYQLPSWYNTMNWSSFYRLDSDIPNPYGCLVNQYETHQKDYMSIYNAKTRNALWVVSHCQVASARRLYVNEMIRYGFDIDIFGGCGSDGRKLSAEELDEIIPRYKFYIGFENSLCDDYITEKFFKNYNFNWIIIVRGGADYYRLMPTKSFIDTADFSNISELVDYITILGNDREKYIDFLRIKDRFTSVRWPGNSNCEICRRLNNLPKFEKTYKTMASYINQSQCIMPIDLQESIK